MKEKCKRVKGKWKMGLLDIFGNKRVFVFLLIIILIAYFIIVNNPTLEKQATKYLIGALIVLFALPALKLMRMGTGT